MRDYWMDDLKKTEKAVYIGHISAEDVMCGVRDDIIDELNSIKDENDMTGLRFSILRDLTDEYPDYPGYWYGKDVWLIVKPGYFKKNQKLIEEFREVFDDFS